jgi:hypothetical protein
MKKIMEWVAQPLSRLTLRGCFGQVIGGAASRVPDNATAVHPGFRKGLIAASCFGFPFKPLYEWANEEFNDWGDGGAYVNEPQSTLPDWIERFWTKAKYEQLVAIKRKWDPDNVFLVHHGVGSDSVANTTDDYEDDGPMVASVFDNSTNAIAAQVSVPIGMPDCMRTASPRQCHCVVKRCATEIEICLADIVCAAGLTLPHTPLILMSTAKGVTLQSCADKACLSTDINIVV